MATTSSATPAAAREYLPAPHRTGVALCLSGGGSRAGVFHLGVVRRFNERGLLSQVNTITGVSGGSMFAGHLASAVPDWPAPGTVMLDFDAQVACGFETFVRRNLRTSPLARRLLFPWNWARDQTAVDALAELLAAYLNSGTLANLPLAPRFVFCASDNVYGVNWTFERTVLGDYMAGYGPPGAWTVARAVAASACFPPLFDPMESRLPPQALSGGHVPVGPARDAAIRGLRLSDGGLYDNLGIEPVWKDHAVVLVSDGGAIFDALPDQGLLTRLKRYATIMGRQSTALRKRWLIAGYIEKMLAGAYIGIGTPTERYESGVNGYSAELVTGVIAQVRTDLDQFTDPEIAVLQNHGYLVAEAAIRKHVVPIGLPLLDAPLNPPYPDWLDERRVRQALANSASSRLPFGRGPWLRYMLPRWAWPAPTTRAPGKTENPNLQ